VNVAIIPARGGSKRIPRKNIKSFCGKPIIGYSIQAALASKLFDRIIVSTDDERIAAVSRTQGAETPFIRPKELADDYTGTSAVVRHALQWFQKQGENVTLACCIYATAPFIHPRYLKKGYHILQTSRKSFAFSVTSFSFPIQRAVRILADGSLDAMYPGNVNARSQDLEEAFHDAGQFYWGTVQAFLSDEVLFSPVSMPVILPRYLVQDIDTLEDWKRAELMYKAMEMDSA
jgi:N-acylneuraminate cytidylyltransferase